MSASSTLPAIETVSSPVQETAWLKTIALHSAIFAAAFLILFSRRTDAILHAQFWAEDGKYFYADGYHYGWRCLLLPYGGYLHTTPRLVGLLAQLVPFASAPLLMNLCGIAFQILPLNIFLSSRFNIIPFVWRVIGGFLYLALPNIFEIHANTANLQWHLALASCLIVLARSDDRLAWRMFDALLLALFSITSLMGILLVPVAALMRWMRRDPRYNLSLLALIPGAVIQASIMLFSHNRPTAPNGATLARLSAILGGQVFYASVLSMKSLLLFYLLGDQNVLFSIELVALAIGLPIVIYAAWKGPLELKAFLLFATLVFAMAMRNPLVAPDNPTPQWELLRFPGLGNRYYFFPMIGFLASLTWMAASGSTTKLARYSATAILLLVPIGVYRDWQLPKYKEFHFQFYAAQFEQAAPGTTMNIPLNPTGWRMTLVKKP